MTTTVAPPDIAPYGWLLPPSDEEKLQYLRAPQHRWIFVVSAMAFAGVAASLAGFATQSYWTAVFLLPLALLVVEQAISLRTSTLRRRVTPLDHQFLVETYAPVRYPSVDVFLPTAGEDVELLENTYRHVARLRWPGALTVNVLDDVGNQPVAELAAEYGFRYLARPGNEFKKAGNLHYAYTRTSGEFILILDADFVPRPDFLLETVPYFEQESVGVVQSPQYFSTSPSMFWLERCAGATQELFFRHIQPSRDSVAAAICVGTSAVYRRAALQSIGGFPLIPHSEDVFTGVLLGRQGYRVQYVPVVLSRGRCPDEIGAFLAQQYRWCEGSMALIADRRFHEDASMTGMQRLSFWAGFLYYVTTAVMAVLAPLPVLVMVTFFPANINMMNLLPLLGVVVLWLVVFPAVSLSRWRIEVLRVQTLYGFAHLFSMLDAARGKVMEWVATGAGSAPRRTVAHRVQRFMVPYLAVTQVLVFAGLLHGAMEFGVLRYSFNIAFALLGGYVFLPVVWLGRGAFVPAPRPAGRHGSGTGTESAISPTAHVIDVRSRRPVGRHAARVTSEPAKARGA